VRVVQDDVAGQRAFTRFRTLGLTRSQALEALAPRPLPIDVLERAPQDGDQGVLYVGMLVLFMALAGSARRLPSA
jgi:hypothetical protein